jgi:hypothetical protein
MRRRAALSGGGVYVQDGQVKLQGGPVAHIVCVLSLNLFVSCDSLEPLLQHQSNEGHCKGASC